jgi:DNA-binding NtrC family response regulator
VRSEVSEAGRFRGDLFYRLNVVHITLPPLRERRADTPLLVAHLMHRLNAKLGTDFAGIAPEALRTLVDLPWKGNVRELENVLERAMVLGGGATLSVQHFADAPTPPRRSSAGYATRSASSSASTCATSSSKRASTSARPPGCSGSASRRSTASSACSRC